MAVGIAFSWRTLEISGAMEWARIGFESGVPTNFPQQKYSCVPVRVPVEHHQTNTPIFSCAATFSSAAVTSSFSTILIAAEMRRRLAALLSRLGRIPVNHLEPKSVGEAGNLGP